MKRRSPASRTTEIPRLAYLDALRGFAALYVVMFHVSLMPKPALAVPDWLRAFVGFGGSGVTLFFIISGFSMCLSWKRHATAASPLKSFYLNRLARIAPLFYFWLALSIGRDAVFKGAGSHGAVEIGANALFLFNLYEPFQFGIVWASWTIGVEMLFYAVFPFVKRQGVDTLLKTSLLLAASLVVVAVARALTGNEGQPAQPMLRGWFDNVGFFFVLPIFLLGIVTYHVHDVLQSLKIAELRRWLAALLLVPALAVLGLLAVYRPTGVVWYYMAAVGYALLLLGLSASSGRFVVNRVTSYLGRISYSLYLNHPSLVYALIPIYVIVYKMNLGSSAAFMISAALTLVILVPLSHLTFKFIESPPMKWERRGGVAKLLARQTMVAEPKSSKSDA